MNKLQNLTWVPFAIALTATLATLGFALGNGEHEAAPNPDLPKVRYRIRLPQLPPNSTLGGGIVNDMNNVGEVVGLYSSPQGITAFLYAPARNVNQAIDLNDLATGGIPDGARLSEGVAINDWGVVVGCLQQANGTVHPFALDLGAETPAVDLLPNFGANMAYATQINENGDIIVQIMDTRSAYLFNPGLYNGDPGVRASRDGVSQNFSEETPQLLPARLSFNEIRLNNPLGERPAQIAGLTKELVAFRYTTGKTPQLETFSGIGISTQSHIEGLNDAGIFCGLNFELIVEGSYARDPFLYDRSLKTLPWNKSEMPQDINASGDLLTWEHVYREDWGFVRISEIVTGTPADLAVWNRGNFTADCMTDRIDGVNAAQIAGRLDGVFDYPAVIVLTPESVPD